MTSPLLYTRLIAMVLVGGFAMVFGEFDDSPGLQGIGLIVIIVGVWLPAVLCGGGGESLRVSSPRL